MSMISLRLTLLVGFFLASVQVLSAPAEYWSPQTRQQSSIGELIKSVQPGDVVLIGEQHGMVGARDSQLEIMNALRQNGLRVSVGMEFLEYPTQSDVDSYRTGLISEEDFLKKIGWGGFSYDLYREQILFPIALEGGATRALNCPRSVTGKVAKKGLSSLAPEEQAFLPPNLTRGNDRYFERFLGAVGGHLPTAEAAERYFWAQSIWDETMAWKSLEWVHQNPDQVFVIVVGGFHVEYGGGLPDRIRARGLKGQVHTIVQVSKDGLEPGALDQILAPHPVDGYIGDIVVTFQ